jgi:hypothetical protein
MSKDIRQMIDKVKNFNQFINENKKTKYQLSIDKENDRLLNLYPNLKFSSKWNNEVIPRYMETDNLTFEEEYNNWKIYYTKQLLEPFIKFYNEYKPYSYPKRFGNYEMYYSDDVKQQFDKIIKGDLYVDEEFQIPDSPIRNYMKIYHFDKINIDNYNKK